MINSYESLPLEKYLQILDIPKDLPEYDYKVKVLSVLSGMDEDSILDQPLLKTMKMAEEANFLTTPLPEGNGKQIASSYRIGDLELIPAKNVRKWTTAQFVDFQTFISKNNPSNLPELYSCILIPKGYTYNNGYDIADVHKAVSSYLPVTAARQLSAFFFRKFMDSSRSILTSSLPYLWIRRKNPEAKRMIAKIRKIIPLLKNGDGWRT